MITLEDCMGMCGLNEAEIAALAEHEHLAQMEAAALANYLLHQAGGVDRIRQMLIDDIRAAGKAGNLTHAAELLGALRHFLQHHPQLQAV